MKLIGIIDEDFINYKKPAMAIEFPRCNFKCDIECGRPVCQNSALVNAPTVDVDIETIIKRYLDNPITEAIVFQGLEPFDSFLDLKDFISLLRDKKCFDDIVIYTGYNIYEIEDLVKCISFYGVRNIMIKFGRYIPNQQPHYDEVLGIYLASDNQYGERIC